MCWVLRRPRPQKWRAGVAVRVRPPTRVDSCQSSSRRRSAETPQRSRWAPTPRGTANTVSVLPVPDRPHVQVVVVVVEIATTSTGPSAARGSGTGWSRLGPAKGNGEQRSPHTGSNSTRCPSISASTLEWPIHVRRSPVAAGGSGRRGWWDGPGSCPEGRGGSGSPCPGTAWPCPVPTRRDTSGSARPGSGTRRSRSAGTCGSGQALTGLRAEGGGRRAAPRPGRMKRPRYLQMKSLGVSIMCGGSAEGGGCGNGPRPRLPPGGSAPSPRSRSSPRPQGRDPPRALETRERIAPSRARETARRATKRPAEA